MQTYKKLITLFIITAVITATLADVTSNAGQQADSTTTLAAISDTASATATTEYTRAETTESSVKEEPESTITYSKEIPLSFSLQGVMQQACFDYGVPYALALAVAECESSFNLEADNGICWGIMQINPCNYSRLRQLGIEPTDYDGNIIAGVYMLSELLNKYGDTHKALMAYNCGEAGASSLWNQGYETSAYSRKVTAQFDFWQETIQN